MDELLHRDLPPDAVFVANNLMAAGALRALRRASVQPPEFGISVFGDIPFIPFAPDTVHVVPLKAREIGACAARLLLDRIGGHEGSPKQIVVDSAGRAFEASATLLPQK
jgi:LacI family transcriptional regulator